MAICAACSGAAIADESASVSVSLTGVVQGVNGSGAVGGARETRGIYRGDVTLELPAGSFGASRGRIFSHVRFGHGAGVHLRPSYSNTPDAVAFPNAGESPDDAHALLAQAWYQLDVPLGDGAGAPGARAQLELNAGKMDPFVFFDQNAAADDESVRFMNSVFVHNPLLDSGGDAGVDVHGFSPGLRAAYVDGRRASGSWGASVGVFGSGPGADLDGSLRQAFVITQIEDHRTLPDGLAGSYRLYLWRNGRAPDYAGGGSVHSGLGLSADQQVGDALTVFARYGHQLSGKVRFDRALTLGGEIGGAYWSRPADGLGIAAGFLRTSEGFRRDSATVDADGDGTPDLGYAARGAEAAGEIYYRFRLMKQLEITPDFQLIRRPGGDPAAPMVRVLGLRLRVSL
jgi:high affinity Mn2+ porin